MAISNLVTAPKISPFNLGGTTPKVSPFGLGGSSASVAPTASIAPTTIKPISGVQSTVPKTSTVSPTTPVKGLITPPVDNSALLASTTAAANKVAQQLGGSYTQAGGYVPAPTTTGSTGPTQPPATTYSGLVGNVAGQGGALNTQAQKINTTAGLIGSQGQMTPEEQTARQRLAELTGIAGDVNSNIEQHPSDFAFQMGREAVAQRNIDARNQSLAQSVSALAAERAANTGAYQAEAGAESNAGGLINSAGGLYGNAANLAQKSITAPGQAVFDPLTGQYTSASSGGGTPTTAPSDIDQNSWNQYIQAYASGNIASIPGAITGNANLAGQLQAAVQAQNPGYDYASATGSAGARASNAGLAGTATPNAYNSIYTSALNDYTNLQQSVQNVDQFGNLLTSNMTAGGINPTDVKYANKTLAQIRGQLSSGAQAQYDTTLAALKSKVSGMLAVGGSETPTALTADAQKILDGSLPLSALNDVLGRIQTEGNILLQNQAGKVNTAKSGTMGPTGPQGGGSNTGAITWDSILSH